MLKPHFSVSSMIYKKIRDIFECVKYTVIIIYGLYLTHSYRRKDLLLIT